jgi:hypothetical protein
LLLAFAVPIVLLSREMAASRVGQNAPTTTSSTDWGGYQNVTPYSEEVLAALRAPGIRPPSECRIELLFEQAGTVKPIGFLPANTEHPEPRFFFLTADHLTVVRLDGSSDVHPLSEPISWREDPCLQVLRTPEGWRLAALAESPARIVGLDLEGAIRWQFQPEMFDLTLANAAVFWMSAPPLARLSQGTDREGRPLLFLHSEAEEGIACLSSEGEFLWYRRTRDGGPRATIVLAWAPTPPDWPGELFAWSKDGERLTGMGPDLELHRIPDDPVIPRALGADRLAFLLSAPDGHTTGTLEALRELPPAIPAAPDPTRVQVLLPFGPDGTVGVQNTLQQTMPELVAVEQQSGRWIGTVVLVPDYSETHLRLYHAGLLSNLEADRVGVSLLSRTVHLKGETISFEFLDWPRATQRIVGADERLAACLPFLLPDGLLLGLSIESPRPRMLLLRLACRPAQEEP